MKFKTQKEVKEETHDENKSNPIHEYLDIAFKAHKQFEALKHMFKPWVNRIVLPPYEQKFENLFQTFEYKNNGVTIKYTHDPLDAISIICDVMDELVEEYNIIYSKISPFNRFLLVDSLPFGYEITIAKQIYKDFQENFDKAKEKWCKCE